jgi:hypothetical protein
VLPFSYTSLVADSLHANNPGLKAFVDLFQHRAVTLFYGAGLAGEQPGEVQDGLVGHRQPAAQGGQAEAGQVTIPA